jgi:hypothetical protein
MKVIVYTQNGSIFFDEFRNDHEQINLIIEKAVEKETLDEMWNSLWADYSEDLWNEYMRVMICVLEEAGCEILWDR